MNKEIEEEQTVTVYDAKKESSNRRRIYSAKPTFQKD